jgi:hypothetical protein
MFLIFIESQKRGKENERGAKGTSTPYPLEVTLAGMEGCCKSE